MIFECDTEETYLGSAGEITGICVSRPVNGITLNGLEWLYWGDNKNIMLFPDKSQATQYLTAHGCTEQDIQGFRFFYHVACQHCGMWLLVEDCDITTDEMGVHAYHSSCGHSFNIS